MIIRKLNNSYPKRGKRSDAEVVNGLQSRDRKIEEWFFHTAKRFFDDHYNEVFFDKDRKQEIFQAAFLKLWMEMDNGRIGIRDGAVLYILWIDPDHKVCKVSH